MNLGISFTHWQGVGSPEWTGLDNYRRLLDDDDLLGVVPPQRRADRGDGDRADALGLVLAAALFDYIGKKFGTGTAQRAPRLLLPAAGPARSRWPASSGAGSCTPTTAR